MTDAALSVTQSAVEHFTEQYLRTLDATIEKDGDRWIVTIPENSVESLPNEEVVLICGEVESELDDDQGALNPRSSFFQNMLTEASKAHRVGEIPLAVDTEIELPPWLEKGSVEVASKNFTPYYDRTAVVLLYKVSIETVSDYQTELLQAIALDNRTMTDLPALEKLYLRETSPQRAGGESSSIEIGSNRLSELVEETRERVVDRVDDTIQETHQEASRAADAELEEYRQLQQQRIEELEGELSSLTSKIDELSETVQDDDDQEDQVQSLKKRKELRSEKEDIESELEELRQRRARGFPEKQREIRDRHDLEVVVTPLSVSQVEYERGELDIKLHEGDTKREITVGYGEGIGVTEEIVCEDCGYPLTDERPLQTLRTGLICERCASER